MSLPKGKHNTLIDGVANEITGGKVLVNGTGHEIVKGRTLVAGTGYDIKFDMVLGDLPVGTSVFANVNGVRTEFIIVHQGLPSSSYDDSCSGSWLLTKDIYTRRAWNSRTTNAYGSSSIHNYLNSTFYNWFDANVKSAIKSVKIPYTKTAGSMTVTSGSSGLSANAFLLSGYEIGWVNSSTSLKYLPAEGSCLSYFSGASNSKRVANYEGSAGWWFVRSQIAENTSAVWGDTAAGISSSLSATDTSGIRPAVVMYSDTPVDGEYNITPE